MTKTISLSIKLNKIETFINPKFLIITTKYEVIKNDKQNKTHHPSLIGERT
jgi:hypothetical protein